MMTNKVDNPTDFDVVILGGGPAGAAAGITLLKRDDISVAILEKSDYTKSRIGESLTPGIRSLLEYLGVWEQFSKEQSLQSFGSQAAWGSSDVLSLDYMFTLHGPGWGLDRVRFDRLLADYFTQRGGHLLKNYHATKVEYLSSEGWKIQVKESDNTKHEISCKYLIDASGRRSILTKQMNIQRKVYDKLIGVSCVGQFSGDVSLESVTQVEACNYGWWYTSPVPGNKIAVVLMTDSDIARKLRVVNRDKWHELLGKTDITNKRVSKVNFWGEIKAFSCFSSCLKSVGGEKWVAVGDAVASHDPLSSSGIPHAIGSGVQGALVAADSLFAQAKMLSGYQESIHKDFFQYQRTHWQYYTRETRWPESLFWKRRTTEISINPLAVLECADELVDVNKISRLYFSGQRLSQLYDHCQSGKVAHEIVSGFLEHFPRVPDQHVILELQRLVEGGFLKVA